MEFPKSEQLKDRFWSVWNRVFNKPEEDEVPDARREKFVVFLVAFILALCLWLMVNLNRDYNLNINLPITLGNMPGDQALSEELPNFVTVSISGEGWKLINIYNNPPSIYVDVTQQEVSMYEQVREQINNVSDLDVSKVQPLFLNLELEEKISKKVPVRPNVNISYQDQFGKVGELSVSPDSVTVTGAASLLKDIQYWETDSVNVSGVREPVSLSIPLKEPGSLVTLSTNSVNYNVDVSQFTEGEAKIPVQPRNMPEGRVVTFSPSSINVKYNVPIDEYAQVKDLPEPFTAYVDYEQIMRDSTGFVIPRVERASETDFHYELRTFQPGEVAYYIVVGN